MKKVKLDEKIEVTESQYNQIMGGLAGTCFGKKENGKFYIKLGISKYKKEVEMIVNS